MGEYKTLIAKMCEDAALKEPEMTSKQAMARETARHNYDLLCDVGTPPCSSLHFASSRVGQFLDEVCPI